MSDSVTKYFENADSTAPLNKLDMKARITRKQKTLSEMSERIENLEKIAVSILLRLEKLNGNETEKKDE